MSLIRNKGLLCSVEGCEKNAHSRGWCKTHYGHWNKYGDPEAGDFREHYGHDKSVNQRFWERIDKNGPMSRFGTRCWIWTGGHNDKGYSTFRAGYQTYAHRFSFEWHYGPLHRKWDIDHKCFNKGCVNPEHLRAGTRSQNNQNRSGLKANNTSGVHGVWWDKARKRWTGQVSDGNGRRVTIRRKTLEEAEAALIAKRLELYTHNQLDREGVTTCL